MSTKKQELLDARQKVAELLEVVGLEMNRAKRELLAILARRAAWVEKRIQSMAAEGKIRHLHDEEEVKALNWAMNQVVVQEAELKRLREDKEQLREETKRLHDEVKLLREEARQLRAELQEREREKNGFQGFVAKD